MPMQPDRMGRGDVVSADYLNRVAEAVVQRLSIVGGRISRHGTSICIEVDEQRPRGDRSFWAKITANSTDGTNRWSYTFAEVYQSAAGYDHWDTVADGLTGTARNTLENMNGASGMLGNGVTVANLIAGDADFALSPCPINAVVRVFRVDAAGTDTYWFTYANGVDGGCA